METYYWNSWYTGFGYVLWFGFIILIFSSMGNWGYTYQAHRKYLYPKPSPLDLLNARYARGEIQREEYVQIRNEIMDGFSPRTRVTI
jgi:putative membrane protein